MLQDRHRMGQIYVVIGSVLATEGLWTDKVANSVSDLVDSSKRKFLCGACHTSSHESNDEENRHGDWQQMLAGKCVS